LNLRPLGYEPREQRTSADSRGRSWTPVDGALSQVKSPPRSTYVQRCPPSSGHVLLTSCRHRPPGVTGAFGRSVDILPTNDLGPECRVAPSSCTPPDGASTAARSSTDRTRTRHWSRPRGCPGRRGDVRAEECGGGMGNQTQGQERSVAVPRRLPRSHRPAALCRVVHQPPGCAACRDAG
jgi:hypothetical protein